MKRKFTFLTAALALLAFLAIPVGMWGQEVTLDFTTNDCWELPTTSTVIEGQFTCGDYTITLAGTSGAGYKYNTGYLIIGKNGAYLQLPAFSFDVEKIEVVGKSGASSSVAQNIYVGETAVSTGTTGATGTNTYMINSDYQAAGNIYTLKITSNHNSQITNIKVYAASAPSTDPTITATPTTLAVPNQVVNAYDGTQTATLDVEGSNLTDNVTIALNGGTDSKFEMTIDNGQTWHSTLSLEQNSGEVAIRLKDNLEVGGYNDVITLSSEGATDVTVNVSGSVTTPPTYTVTYKANGGSGTMTDPDSPYHAGDVVALLASTFTAPEDMIWDSWQVKDADNNDVEVNNGSFIMPASNVTVTAQWVTDPNAPEYEWVLTDLANLTDSDVFVIVGDNGSTYAMTNDNGTGSAPDATAVIVVANKLSVAPADNLKWTIGGNATDGYTFYPNGSTTTWLYCTNTNNGVRIGTNSNKTFKMDANSGYLKHDGTSRYIGIYNSSDWRCYTSAGGNIADQTFAFYKRQEAGEEAVVTIVDDKVTVSADGDEGILTVQYQNINDIVAEIQFYEEDGETETTSEYYEDWFTAEVNGENNVSYLAIENTGAERKAYFKVFALDNNNELVYSNLVTITQSEYVAPALPSNYVLTDFADLSPADVFVIVGKKGDNYYALPHNGGASSAPAAIKVTLVGDNLAASTDFDNLRWNISGNETVGYTFYPYRSNGTWLYCTNTNNGVRVGTGDAKHFTMSEDGYLTTTETVEQRYIGIYINNTNSADWRCYTSAGGNIAEQTFAFYRLVSDEVQYTKNITGYGSPSNDGGYYLIASPVASVTPTSENGFIANPAENYDLYSFDPREENEWRNFKQHNFNLVSGQGYLYANMVNTELTFKGQPYNGNGVVTLSYSETNPSEINRGINLVGNPYSTKALPSKDYYILNDDGDEIMTESKSDQINPMEGIFVVAETDGETMTFSPQDEQPAPQQLSQIVANLRQGSRNSTIDRAIVRFGDDSQLPKFMLNEENTKLYIPQNGMEYALVSIDGEEAMPISFKAAQNGTYTLSFEVENLEMNQLTLIDNMTGTQTDLLACPSYTFDARTADYASRFRLVFSTTGIEENGENTNFAYYNGSEWVINASENATVEVVDMMGRVVRTANGTVSATGMTAGVYMLRLIDGNNVKTQKIVVK